MRLTTASAACAARYEVTAHGQTERQANFHSMLPTEAKNQQCATSKTDPATLSKSYPLDLVLEAQRKIKGRRAFRRNLPPKKLTPT